MNIANNKFAISNLQFSICNSCIGLFLLIGILLLAGCNSDVTSPTTGGGSPAKTAPTTIDVVEVTEGQLNENIEVPCTIEGYEQAMLVPRIEGYVSRVLVNIGDSVTSGQVLAELRVPELHAEVSRRKNLVIQAEADVVSRQAEVSQTESRLVEQQALESLRRSQRTRISNLVDGGALKREQLEEAQYALEATLAAIERGTADVRAAEALVQSTESAVSVAQAEWKKSLAMADYTKIRAPFDGLITRRLVDPGALVRPAGNEAAMAMFEVASVDRVRVILFLPMNEARELDDGDPAELHSLSGQGDDRISGSISRHARAFHQGSRMMQAEIDLDNPLDAQTGRRRFVPGDYGRVTLTLRTITGPAVPLSALIKSNGSRAVIVVDEKNQCWKTTVAVAFEGTRVALLSDPKMAKQRVVKMGDSVEDKQQLSAGSIQTASITIE